MFCLKEPAQTLCARTYMKNLLKTCGILWCGGRTPPLATPPLDETTESIGFLPFFHITRRPQRRGLQLKTLTYITTIIPQNQSKG